MTINDQTASFCLARTNPKIAGNIKITVDSTGGIWLNTINASKELSSSEFKRFRISKTSNYASDLKRFIDKLPPEVVFKVKQGADPDAISGTFKDQYDLFYAMGAEPLISDAYSEDYTYLAPIWLRDQLPDYFVIFRINDPMDFPYNENVVSGSLILDSEYKVSGTDYVVLHQGNVYVDGQTFIASNINYTVLSGTGSVILLDENKALPLDYAQLFNDLVKKAEIVETFDLTENSDIGKYIRKIKDDSKFPMAPISVRFDEGLLTTWNGVAYQQGVMTTKGERLENYWGNAQTQIEFEQFITQGFERQGIISPFLLNLEFLFNDESAALYTIPRYMGFYVSKKEIGSFQLDGQKLFDNRSISGNTPLPKRANKGFNYQDESYFQNNVDGVRLYYGNATGIIPDSTFFEPSNFEPRFYWIQDKDGKFYSLDKLGAQYNLTETDLVIRNTSIDLGKLAGPFDVKSRSKGSLLASKGRSYATIKINDQLFPNDTLRIYWNIGTQTDINGQYDEVIANDLRRYFTVAPGGTVISIFGNLTAVYALNDTVEISYAPINKINRTIVSTPVYNGTDTVFTIDLPINNTAVSGYVNIVGAWGPGSYLAAANMTPIYFHPFGTTSEIAMAVAGAFNSLEQRTFDCIAIGDTVVIRMRAPRSDTNQFFVTIPTITLDTRLDINGANLSLDPTGNYNFQGGTDRHNIRLRVGRDELETLAAPDTYVKTKLGTSRIVWTGLYMDEPIKEVGGSDIASLGGFDDYGVIEIENVLDEPTLGSTNEYVAYTLYKIPVGVFSMFNLKDIDSDFWSSSYGISPLHEFKRYFNIPAGENVLVYNREYLVLGDNPGDSVIYGGTTYAVGSTFTVTVANGQSYTVTSGSPFVVAKIFFTRIIQEAEPMLTGTQVEVLGDPVTDSVIFYSPAPSLPIPAGSTYPITVDGTYYLKTTPATMNSVVINTSITANDADIELRSFPGFSKFKDFLTIEEENVDKNTILFKFNDKYFFNDIETEYDYLKENYNKDLANVSRLNQWISKWVYKGGLDIRNNPYRLNTSPVFGEFNFSPSHNIRVQNPEGFTHEWYYLEGRPNQYITDWDADNYYFFPGLLDFGQLTNAAPASTDYFSSYFTIQPTTVSPHQERYTIFDYNSEIGLCETFFHGAKIRIKEAVRDTRDPAFREVKPPFKKDSTRFDNYKFTALLRTRSQDDAIVESPVTIQVIENETHKTITVLVDVIINDYRAMNLIDPGVAGDTTMYHPLKVPQVLDYTLLYSLKSKKTESFYQDGISNLSKGLDVNTISDIKLSVSMDLSAPSGPSGPFIRSFVFDNPDYDWDMRDEIHAFDIPVASYLNSMYGTFQYGDTTFPAPVGVSETTVSFNIGTTFEAPIGNTIVIPYGSDYEWKNFITWQKTGGTLWYEPIMQRASFASIADKINNYSPYIKYCSFVQNGSGSVEVPANFYIEMIRPTTINKRNSLLPIPDNDKPQEFANEAVIGVSLINVNSTQSILRYNGPYEPKFRNVLYFKNQITDVLNSTPPVDLSFQQVTFNPNVPGFGTIKNFGYLKIASNDILSLVNNPRYPSKYPLLDETAIDKMDFPIYLSNWDPGYWRRFITKKTYKPQAGTREMLEIKNFLATKVMKTPRTINIEDFTVEQVTSLDTINPLTYTGEIVYTVSAPLNSTQVNRISGYINIKARLLRYLIEDGASAEFIQYIIPEFGIGDPDNINDDVIEYLTLNVLPTYEIKTLTPYIKLYKELSLNLPYVDGTMDDQDKITAGYRPITDLSTNELQNFIYRFDYNIDPDKYASIALSIIVGKI